MFLLLYQPMYLHFKYLRAYFYIRRLEGTVVEIHVTNPTSDVALVVTKTGHKVGIFSLEFVATEASLSNTWECSFG